MEGLGNQRSCMSFLIEKNNHMNGDYQEQASNYKQVLSGGCLPLRKNSFFKLNS
jgi:hypothetical protein